MRVAKTEKTTPTKQKTRYSITDLSEEEYKTITTALKGGSDDAQKIYTTLTGVDKAIKMFENRQTGEILGYEEMLEQFASDYDGGDPTNPLGIDEYYREV